jgi:hypothetical protein
VREARSLVALEPTDASRAGSNRRIERRLNKAICRLEMAIPGLEMAIPGLEIAISGLEIAISGLEMAIAWSPQIFGDRLPSLLPIATKSTQSSTSRPTGP